MGREGGRGRTTLGCSTVHSVTDGVSFGGRGDGGATKTQINTERERGTMTAGDHNNGGVRQGQRGRSIVHPEAERAAAIVKGPSDLHVPPGSERPSSP